MKTMISKVFFIIPLVSLVACSDFWLPVARTGIGAGIIRKTETPPDFC